jgi:hypothetical protein
MSPTRRRDTAPYNVPSNSGNIISSNLADTVFKDISGSSQQVSELFLFKLYT